MITIQGKGVSKGIAKGPLYFFQRPDTTVTQKTITDIEAEKARLAAAQEASIAQLNGPTIMFHTQAVPHFLRQAIPHFLEKHRFFYRRKPAPMV